MILWKIRKFIVQLTLSGSFKYGTKEIKFVTEQKYRGERSAHKYTQGLSRKKLDKSIRRNEFEGKE